MLYSDDKAGEDAAAADDKDRQGGCVFRGCRGDRVDSVEGGARWIG